MSRACNPRVGVPASTSTVSTVRASTPRPNSLGRAAAAASLALAVAVGPPAFAAAPAPSFSGVDPKESAFIRALVEKSERDKVKNDEARLENFYKRDYRINKLLGGEVLKEPCDPRDPEFGWECRPTLPRLPQDRFAFDDDLREKTGYGLVRGTRDVDAAADALVASELEKSRAVESVEAVETIDAIDPNEKELAQSDN